jgi:Cu/Ag efflux protein CusF
VSPAGSSGRFPIARAGIPVAIILVLAVIFYSSLGRKPAPGPVNPPAPGNVQAPRTYTVRGQIAQLPDPAKPSATLQIKHEAIDDFAGRDGSLGMDSMTMPFPLAPGVSLEGLAVGDIVEFVFELDWSASPTYRVTRIAELPADTALVFTTAKPPER